ncbi:DUF805 domain-containing protein [Bombiscardovia coagulans]|uniref:DUF805 domain-containing protein n=1 Tax=Bombiscardovia coagulans TaxID=686666 RepID=A0A261EV14_9BIFI|nr:DUF805 domain-containing protein [Bombiscardovia coagulans]OZG50711.1 hypothetical protein BOCO_0311 [Bombiscardovia coagulans]
MPQLNEDSNNSNAAGNSPSQQPQYRQPAPPQYGQQVPSTQQPQYGQQVPSPQQPRYGQAAPSQYSQQPQAQTQPQTQPQYRQPAYGQQTPGAAQYGVPGAQYAQQPQNNAQAGNQNPGTQSAFPQNTPVYNGVTNTMAVPSLDQPWYGIGFTDAVKRFFNKYADFKGRASKGEYWWVILFVSLCNILSLFLSVLLGEAGTFIDSIWHIAIFIPLLSVATRRLHDSNLSGGWLTLPIAMFFSGFMLDVVTLASLPTTLYNDLQPEDLYALSPAIGTMITIGGLLMILSIVAWIVLTVRDSKPEGARFDRQTPPNYQR